MGFFRVLAIASIGASLGVAAAPSSRLALRSDADCKLEVNGRPHGVLARSEPRTLTLSPGPARLLCSSAEWPGVQAQVARELPPGQMVEATLRLRWAETPTGLLDRRTRLEWTRADSGADTSWAEATAHCAAIGADWRLPSRAELQGLYQSGAKGETVNCRGAACHLPDLFSLSSYWQWTGQADPDGRQAWYLYLHTGHPQQSPLDYRLNARALCVRPQP